MKIEDPTEINEINESIEESKNGNNEVYNSLTYNHSSDNFNR